MDIIPNPQLTRFNPEAPGKKIFNITSKSLRCCCHTTLCRTCRNVSCGKPLIIMHSESFPIRWEVFFVIALVMLTLDMYYRRQAPWWAEEFSQPKGGPQSGRDTPLQGVLWRRSHLGHTSHETWSNEGRKWLGMARRLGQDENGVPHSFFNRTRPGTSGHRNLKLFSQPSTAPPLPKLVQAWMETPNRPCPTSVTWASSWFPLGTSPATLWFWMTGWWLAKLGAKPISHAHHGYHGWFPKTCCKVDASRSGSEYSQSRTW